MTGFRRPNAVTLAAITALSVWLWAVPARSSPITVDWNVVPHEHGELSATPYYSCSGQIYSLRTCQYLWEQGMELGAVYYSFYDDKWVDGYGLAVLESNIGVGVTGGAVQEIRPRCEPALAPCFDAYTPVAMVLSGDSMMGPSPNLFVLSSKGGLLKFPSWTGRHTIEFTGSLWESLNWLRVGFYLPAVCGDAEPPEHVCTPYQEWALTVDSLTFRPVPEPAALVLLATGMLGWIGQRRAAARRH